MNFISPGFWLAVVIALLICEILTLGLTTIWFAGGALIAFLAALAGANSWVQIILFLVISIVLLVLTRPVAMKYLNRSREKTNVDAVVGKTGIVTVDIDNLKGEGEVTLSGQPWAARTEGEETIAKDSLVEVVAVEGVKLIVKEKTENSQQ